ncbi:hypothetical protein EON66_00320 [archaeon]|nr:MAG: hypothetical protein EON66_00320 [archaeon]
MAAASKYCCPACNAPYCGAACFRRHNTACVEAFYARLVREESELRRREDIDEAARERMLSVLQRRRLELGDVPTPLLHGDCGGSAAHAEAFGAASPVSRAMPGVTPDMNTTICGSKAEAEAEAETEAETEEMLRLRLLDSHLSSDAASAASLSSLLAMLCPAQRAAFQRHVLQASADARVPGGILTDGERGDAAALMWWRAPRVLHRTAALPFTCAHHRRHALPLLRTLISRPPSPAIEQLTSRHVPPTIASAVNDTLARVCAHTDLLLAHVVPWLQDGAARIAGDAHYLLDALCHMHDAFEATKKWALDESGGEGELSIDKAQCHAIEKKLYFLCAWASDAAHGCTSAIHTRLQQELCAALDRVMEGMTEPAIRVVGAVHERDALAAGAVRFK